MKKKYFGNKIDEDDLLTFKRITIIEITDKDTSNILSVTDEKIDDDYVLENNTLKQVKTIKNSDGVVLSTVETEVTEIPEIFPEAEIDETTGNITTTKFVKTTYEKVEAVNTDKLSGDIAEFYKPTDKFSARNLNRPILENFEDIENIYEVLQNICKTLYGQKENGILPDVFEEFSADKIQSGYYLNKNKRYIRIPTGAFFAKLTDKQSEYYKYTKTEDNQYSRDFYIDDDHNAAIVFNRPNTELFERQLGEHFNINLNDQDNDIRMYYYFETKKINKNPTTEEEFIENNTDKYNILRTVKYYMEVSKTNYNYTKNPNGNTIITTTPIIKRIPEQKASDPSNSFELINTFSNYFKSYLSKIDDGFSMEEVIEFPLSQNWQSGNYIIFFDPATKESKTDSFVSYSYSKKFGICGETYFYSKYGNNNDKVIKLFKINVTVENENGIDWNSLFVNTSDSFLSRIDRTTFDIKNVNITNLLNDLVIENKNKNINISEAHLKPNDNETDNISIGFNNLGYSDQIKYSQKSEEQKWANGTTNNRNRALASEGDKFVLGKNNIAIGSYALKNTVKNENSIPENNIAIGKNTLADIQDGKNNIEIGIRKTIGNLTAPEGLINIGDNLEGESKAVKNNTVVGRDNAKDVTLNNNNTIIGINNTSIANSYGKLNDNNIVFGNNNKYNKINDNNIIIGNDNIASDNTSVVKNNNVIIGISNALKNIGNNNYIFGKNNQKNNINDADIENNENIVVGNENNFYLKNRIFGNNNNTYDENSLIIGDNNELLDLNPDIKPKNSMVVGKENELKNNDNIFVLGRLNKNNQNQKTISVGDENKLNSTNNDLIVGSKNIMSNTIENNVFGRQNTVSNNAINNIIIGNENNITSNRNIVLSKNSELKNNDVLLLGGNELKQADELDSKTDLNNEIDDNSPLDVMSKTPVIKTEESVSTTPAIIISNLSADEKEYFKDNDEILKTKYFIKLDTNNDAYIRGKNITISSENLFVDGKLTLPKLYTRGYIYQNPKVDYLLTDAEKLQNSLVPNAGNIENIKNLNSTSLSLINTFKSFIGSYSENDINDGKHYLISIREKNGYGSNNALLVYMDDGLRLKFGNSNGTNFTNNREIIDNNGGQTINGTLNINGKVTLNSKLETKDTITAISFIANSARSLKTDIKSTKYNAVDEINKINVVDFYFKSDEKKENPKVGFIADDTDPIFSTKEKNSMDLYNSVGMLLKAVQELSAENKELKERIEKLENK